MTKRPDLLAALFARRAAAMGVIDQAVIALGNFAIGLAVLRLSSKPDYGAYVLCYTMVILVAGLANALFLAPLSATFYTHDADRRPAMMAATLAKLLALVTPVCAIVAALAAASGTVGTLIVVTALICPGAVAQDFLRTSLFLAERAALAVACDLVLLLVWAGTGAGLVWRVAVPAPLAALIGYGLATIMSAAMAIVVAQLPMGARGTAAHRRWPDILAQGRWPLVGAVVTALQNQAHVFLAGALASVAAVAEMNAARLLLMPMSLLVLGANRTLLPGLARTLAAGDRDRADALARRARRTLIVIIVAYASVVLVARPLLLPALFGAHYSTLGPLIALWSLVLVLQSIDINFSALMQAAGRFRAMTIINMWSSLPVLVCMVPMILAFGVRGNLIVLAGGFAAIDLLLARELRRDHSGSVA